MSRQVPLKEMKQTKTAKNALGVMGADIVCKVLGFFRDVLLGSYFGASYILDAYLIATTVPYMLFSSMANAIGTSFIPVYSKVFKEKGKRECIYFTNKILNIFFGISILIYIIGIIFSKYIVGFIGVGFDIHTMNLTLQLTRIIFPVIIFLSIINVSIGFLQSNKQFIIPAMLSISSNIIIIGAIIISPIIGIKGVAWATLLGILSQMIIQIPALRKKGFHYKFMIDFRDKNVHFMGKLIIPILLGTAVQQINVLVDRMLASGLIEGSISALNFADRIVTFGFRVVSMSIAVVIFPMLSEFKASSDMNKLKDTVLTSINIAVLLILPITFGIIALRNPIIQILFEHGNFDAMDTTRTSSALLFYSIGMLSFGLRDILSRVFYSLHDTKTPMFNGLIALCVNIVLDLLLINLMGHNGLALATSLTSIVTTIFLVCFLRKKIGCISELKIILVILKSIIASLFMGGIVYLFYNLILSLFPDRILIIQIIVFGITVFIGLATYIFIINLLGVKELEWIKVIVRTKFEQLWSSMNNYKESANMKREYTKSDESTMIYNIDEYDFTTKDISFEAGNRLQDHHITVNGPDDSGKVLDIRESTNMNHEYGKLDESTNIKNDFTETDKSTMIYNMDENDIISENIFFEAGNIQQEHQITVNGLNSSGKLLNIKVALKNIGCHPIVVAVFIYDLNKNIRGYKVTTITPPKENFNNIILEGFHFIIDDSLFEASEYTIKVMAQYAFE